MNLLGGRDIEVSAISALRKELDCSRPHASMILSISFNLKRTGVKILIPLLVV